MPTDTANLQPPDPEHLRKTLIGLVALGRAAQQSCDADGRPRMLRDLREVLLAEAGLLLEDLLDEAIWSLVNGDKFP